jgi:hypothetical protein
VRPERTQGGKSVVPAVAARACRVVLPHGQVSHTKFGIVGIPLLYRIHRVPDQEDRGQHTGDRRLEDLEMEDFGTRVRGAGKAPQVLVANSVQDGKARVTPSVCWDRGTVTPVGHVFADRI